jgi:LuxR family maltose regulon positive regulatory protein
MTEVDDYLAMLQQAHFHLVEGQFGEVERWAELRGLPDGEPAEGRGRDDEMLGYINAHLRKYELLVLGRAWLEQGRLAEAQNVLERVEQQARSMKRIDLLLEARLLQARLHQAAGREVQAQEALREALALAQPGEYLRTFLDEGSTVADLLRKIKAPDELRPYIAQLLRAFGAAPSEELNKIPGTAGLVEPLSEREGEVLRLLASGLSMAEIADQLVVAASTVHSHCKSIYAKLGVHRRWDAVQRGRELGLVKNLPGVCMGASMR